jgi:hypothetical protein
MYIGAVDVPGLAEAVRVVLVVLLFDSLVFGWVLCLLSGLGFGATLVDGLESVEDFGSETHGGIEGLKSIEWRLGGQVDGRLE